MCGVWRCEEGGDVCRVESVECGVWRVKVQGVWRKWREWLCCMCVCMSWGEGGEVEDEGEGEG